MTQTEALIASLTTADHRGLTLDGRRYFDWSSTTDEGAIILEVGDGDGDVAQVEMTRDEILALQQTLTAWLLTTQ